LERLLVIAGAGTLIWCGVIVGDGVLAQRNGQRALETAMAVEELTQSPAVEQPVIHSRRSPLEVGAAMAALSIPRVQLSAVVLHGADARTLRRGPGHLEQTAVPGDAGNIVIAGHRDSFFKPLRHIRMDDDIFLETRDGQFHYRVTSLRVVGPREVSVVAPTSEETLTLITCYPFWVLGRAPDRFIVRASRVGGHASSELVAWRLPVRDWLGAPALQTTAPRKHVAPAVAVAHDDQTAVQQAVRQYLATAGAQASLCDISVTGDHASALCVSAGHTVKQEPGRRFVLERSREAWAIRSIELTEPQSARASQEVQP
jgi:sortase A